MGKRFPYISGDTRRCIQLDKVPEELVTPHGDATGTTDDADCIGSIPRSKADVPKGDLPCVYPALLEPPDI